MCWLVAKVVEASKAGAFTICTKAVEVYYEGMDGLAGQSHTDAHYTDLAFTAGWIAERHVCALNT